jgi:hypothetical protein
MAATDIELRDSLLNTLTHVESAYGKCAGNVGKGKLFTFPDLHKTSEGLFLSGWTYWEQFLRRLVIFDLASDPAGILRSEVKKFRTKLAAQRLAEAVLGHPDEDKWVEWSSLEVALKRVSTHLGATNRYTKITQPHKDSIARLKRLRNAVAHKSDKAWSDFKSTAQKAPYSLPATSMKGLTVGRLISAHQVAGKSIFEHSITALRDVAKTLVP